MLKKLSSINWPKAKKFFVFWTALFVIGTTYFYTMRDMWNTEISANILQGRTTLLFPFIFALMCILASLIFSLAYNTKRDVRPLHVNVILFVITLIFYGWFLVLSHYIYVSESDHEVAVLNGASVYRAGSIINVDPFKDRVEWFLTKFSWKSTITATTKENYQCQIHLTRDMEINPSEQLLLHEPNEEAKLGAAIGNLGMKIRDGLVAQATNSTYEEMQSRMTGPMICDSDKNGQKTNCTNERRYNIFWDTGPERKAELDKLLYQLGITKWDGYMDVQTFNIIIGPPASATTP